MTKLVMDDGACVDFVPNVTIIESQKKEEYFNGINEGNPLQSALKLMNIECQYFPIFTKEGFCSLLCNEKLDILKPKFDLNSSKKVERIYIPVLHISAHGCTQCMRFTDGQFLSWKELGKILTPINQKCNNILMLCMSACEGISAIKGAEIFNGNNLPFSDLCAPTKVIEWSSSLLAFLILYKRFDMLIMDKSDELKQNINTILGTSVIFNIVNAGEYQDEWKKKRIKSILQRLRELRERQES